MERVVERAQVGVDLGQHVAGQEAEALAGLHRRSGEDDAADLAGLEGLDGQGHGQVRLARPGRPDPEGHDVGRDGVGVGLLARRLRAGRPGPGTTAPVRWSGPRRGGRRRASCRWCAFSCTASRPWPDSSRMISSWNSEATRSASAVASAPTGSTETSLPRTAMWTSGNAASIRRSSSSRWPRRPAMRWLPGTRIFTGVPATCALSATLPAGGAAPDTPAPGRTAGLSPEASRGTGHRARGGAGAAPSSRRPDPR